MDPASVHQSVDRETAEAPSAMRRLELAEGEVRRMSGDIASLVQSGHQQNQQYQQQQVLVQQQQQQIATLSQLLARLTPAPEMAAEPAPLRHHQTVDTANLSCSEPQVGAPERFDGDPDQVRPFITNCRLVFNLRPRSFATEAAKVAFTINHLTGRARIWGTAEFERESPACSSFELFSREMIKVFDIGSSSAEASRELMSIRQGKRSIADYSIDFRTLASRSSWNSEALVDAYLFSLADYLKDELVSHVTPTNLDDAIALSARIDRRVQARRRERIRQNRPPTGSLGMVGPAPTLVRPPATMPNITEHMEVNRTSLSAAERQRRLMGNLCLYCGGGGHRLSSCPLKDRAHRMMEGSG